MSSVFIHVAYVSEFPSFFRLNNIQLSHVSHLSIHPSLDTWAASTFWLLWTMLLQTSLSTLSLCLCLRPAIMKNCHIKSLTFLLNGKTDHKNVMGLLLRYWILLKKGRVPKHIACSQISCSVLLSGWNIKTSRIGLCPLRLFWTYITLPHLSSLLMF